MKCPRTGKDTQEIEIDGVRVDVSTGCGGVFFDNFEIKKFDEKDEKAGDALIDHMRKYANKDIDVSVKITCPRCKDTIMQQHFFNIQRKVSIDQCGACNGVWLDAGELLTLRDTYPDEAEREAAAEAYIKDVLENSDLQKLKEKSEEDLRKARQFAKTFRFICPSNYIPGKQDWGAF